MKISNDDEQVCLEELSIDRIPQLCHMMASLGDETRVFYPAFEILDLVDYVKVYLMFLVRLLFNSFVYRVTGKYFLGLIAINGQGQAVGFAHLEMRFYDFFTFAEYRIVVREDYRGGGLGSRLTSQIIEYARRYRVDKITLTVVTSHESAVRLYQNNGFVIDGLSKCELVWKNRALDLYHMTLCLNESWKRDWGQNHIRQGNSWPSQKLT